MFDESHEQPNLFVSEMSDDINDLSCFVKMNDPQKPNEGSVVTGRMTRSNVIRSPLSQWIASRLGGVESVFWDLAQNVVRFTSHLLFTTLDQSA
jgi:hypothetical protein